MSEKEKTDNCVTDSQDTHYEDSQTNDKHTTSLNESQDFHLVDIAGDESSQSEAQDPIEESKPEEKSAAVSHNTELQENVDVVEATSNKVTCPDSEKDMSKDEEGAQKTELPKIVVVDENSTNESSNLEGKKKHSDEEDEIIQCTPPETYVASKKEVITNTEVTKLKRKAESFEEPPSKILKTSSGDDALSSAKRQMEQEESCQSFKSDDSNDEFPKNCTDTNIIIAETQDLMDDEPTESVSGEQTKNNQAITDDKDLESQLARIHQNDNENFVEKDHEIDKNENLNNTSILNQANKESSEKLSVSEKIAQADDNKSSPLQVQEKDSTSSHNLITDEKTKLQSSTDVSSDRAKLAKDLEIDLEDAEIVNNDEKKTVDKENGVEPAKEIITDLSNPQEVSILKESTNEYHSNAKPTNTCKSRMSIEVVYDKIAATQESKSKPRELVEIDEDGEKIVLDSSQEDSDFKPGSKSILDNTKAETVYKSCYESKSSSDFSYKTIDATKESSLDSAKSDSKLVNGSSESKRCDTDSTASLQSDIFTDIPAILDRMDSNISTSVHNVNKPIKTMASVSKDSDNADLFSISENEPDVSIVDDGKSKSDLTHSSSVVKATQVEREVGMYVRMKCLLHVDESTKEYLSKEVMTVHCEAISEPPLTRQKNNDTSASLADISGNDNKDTSPGSVNSNPQLYQLNPSRLSFASTISSLSSASSAASLAAKLAIRDNTHFSLPRGPAKHARKLANDASSTDKHTVDEAYDRLTKEWQNSRLLTTTILNFANAELTGLDTYNVSNERLDEQLQKMRSSTPEVRQNVSQIATPKSTKKGKSVKRPRSKSTKSEEQSNGLSKISPKVLIPADNNSTPNRKKNKTEHIETTPSTLDVPTKSLLSDVSIDGLIGKKVFAKWSDNNYYPGTVIDKVKTKYKVNFYDGKNKVLIEDFIIPIPNVLNEGLSVYATTKDDDYGSCGIIVDVETYNNDVFYAVETDEGETIRVQVQDIFLSSDQALVLKEEANLDTKSLPATPKHLGQVTLDNVVDGKRRSRRIATPVFSTPKSRQALITPNKNVAEPSVSGVASKLKKEKKAISESEGLSSDSNISVKEESVLSGVQPEIIGTPNEQIVKGPQSRMKSKARSKKKEDEETISTLGPIPRGDSGLFKGMCFILTCASLETIDRYQTDNKDCGSDPGTENEEEWVKKPFVRERLRTQIIAGGGTVYTDFSEIPQDEYKNTKLITNVPNTTAKTLLCLSVGIPAYNHNWIIRCCQEGKVVSPAEDELPAGWSLDKQSYVEMFQRSSNKPLTQVVIIIPTMGSDKQFTTFWRQICENAGAVVLLADNPDAMEGFVEGTVVVTNMRCPSWAIERANELQIPLLSTTWIVQCLIEGKLCSDYSHPRYKYNHI